MDKAFYASTHSVKEVYGEVTNLYTHHTRAEFKSSRQPTNCYTAVVYTEVDKYACFSKDRECTIEEEKEI
jgi:phage-related protein